MLLAKVFLDFDVWAVVPKRQAAHLSAENTPFFVIHSTTDATVPFQHARLFTETYPETVFWKLESYEHVEAYEHPKAIR